MPIELSEITIEKLNFIDKCREQLSAQDKEILKLPQIIVVGDQSSGKSSILEALSGIKLPKGQNTVTKRPIVVRMRKQKEKKEKWIIKWGHNNKRSGVKMDEVENTIREIQGEKVVDEPIYVDVFSPNVPPLTIIDLPGIVKQAVGGQDISIVEDTKRVATKYMEQQNSLILCVIPSNVDFSTVDTINLAEKCDADKSRTIGVLTKLDKLTEEEIDQKINILLNKSKPLKKGYFGLILSDSILSLDHEHREVREREEFNKIGTLWNKCENNLGLVLFENKLVGELASMINVKLPLLKFDMDKLLDDTKRDLNNLAGPYHSFQNKRRHLIEVRDYIISEIESSLVKGSCKLHQYQKCLNYLKDEKIINSDPKDKHDTFMYGQHKIFTLLHEKFTNFYKSNFRFCKSLYTVKYLQDLSERCSTEHIPIFLSSEPFREIIRIHITEFQKFSFDCLKTCRILAEKFIGEMINNDKKIHSKGLKDTFQNFCFDQLNKQNDTAIERISIIFKSELPCFTQKALGILKDDKDAIPTENLKTGVGNETPLTNVSKTANKLSNSTSMNLASATKDGDNISLNGREDTKNSSGKKLKETLEEYIQNMICRLGDVVPNLIMLSLFEEFHSKLTDSLNTHISGEDILVHFKLSVEDEERIKGLMKTESDISGLLEELKIILSKDRS